MSNYSLYFKLSNHPLPFKKVVTLNANDNMSVFGLLDIANLHLSNVGVMASIQIPNGDGEIESRNIPMRLSKVDVWQYMEDYKGYIGVSKVVNNPLPVDLKVIAFLKEEL